MHPDLPQIAARLYGVPLLVSQPRLETLLRVLEPRLFQGATGEPARTAAPSSRPVPATATNVDLYQTSGGATVTREGIALVQATGTMVRRGSFLGAESGVSSYAGLERDVIAALTDPDVKGVMLELDTPGGEAGGVFDMAEALAGAKEQTGKPLWAIANESALSAGYAIAAVADQIWVPRTAEVGSVGVVAAHVDQSKRNANEGLSVTYVYAGDHKIDGNPHAPLPDAVRADLQRDIDGLYNMFVEHVAKHRGVTPETVRGTEARVYRAADAVKAGLADSLGTLSEALDAMAQETGRSRGAASAKRGRAASSTQKERVMANANTPAPENPEAVTPEASAAPETPESGTQTAEATQAAPEAQTAPAASEKPAEGAPATQAVATAAMVSTEQAAEVLAACQKATALGVPIDAAQALRKGLTVAAINDQVVKALYERDEAAAISTARPVPSGNKPDSGWDAAFSKTRR